MILNFALLIQFLMQEKALKINSLQVDPKKLKIDIKAGPDGLWGAILRLLRLDTKNGYTVDLTGVRRTSSGFVNVSRTYAPLYNLSTAVYFLVKPIGAFISGIFFGMAATFTLLPAMFDRQGPQMMPLMMGVIFAAISLACLWMFLMGDRTAVLGVMTNAATIVSIKLKVKSSDFRDLQQAIAIIETVVARAQGQAAGPVGSSAPSSSSDDLDELEDADDTFESSDDDEDEPVARKPVSADATGKKVIQCPNCSANLKLNASIMGSRIRCPACQEPFVAK